MDVKIYTVLYTLRRLEDRKGNGIDPKVVLYLEQYDLVEIMKEKDVHQKPQDINVHAYYQRKVDDSKQKIDGYVHEKDTVERRLQSRWFRLVEYLQVDGLLESIGLKSPRALRRELPRLRRIIDSENGKQEENERKRQELKVIPLSDFIKFDRFYARLTGAGEKMIEYISQTDEDDRLVYFKHFKYSCEEDLEKIGAFRGDGC
jgi:hypothetical protein